mgnify:CR=1 FL=1
MPVRSDALETLAEEIGADQVAEMLELFFNESDRRVAMFAGYVASGEIDRSKLHVEAHSMKGGAATLGFATVAEEARAIELEAQTIAADALGSGVARLAAAVDEIRQRHSRSPAFAAGA